MDIILDTETTGLKPEIDELLQVSIIDTNGVILLNEYIKPDRATEWTDAMRINQITPEMVANAPSIRDPYLHAKIQHILNNADKVIGYNTMFDIAFLAAAGFDVPQQDELIDVMEEFAEKYGELRDDGSYKWQRLTTAAAYYGFEWPIDAHNSLGDCLATLHVYNCMHKKIVTNGDKIRSMTDEELADLIDRDELMKKICGNECGSVCDEECENAMCNFYDYIMDAPAVNRWIPCSERLPENDAKCLVYTSDKRVCMARWYGKYDEQGAWYIISDAVTKLYRINNVPFWMPLPEPPKGGAEDATD